jgi:hypothetical protein
MNKLIRNSIAGEIAEIKPEDQASAHISMPLKGLSNVVCQALFSI